MKRKPKPVEGLVVFYLPYNGRNVPIYAEQSHAVTVEQAKDWAEHVKDCETNFLRGV